MHGPSNLNQPILPTRTSQPEPMGRHRVQPSFLRDPPACDLPPRRLLRCLHRWSPHPQPPLRSRSLHRQRLPPVPRRHPRRYSRPQQLRPTPTERKHAPLHGTASGYQRQIPFGGSSLCPNPTIYAQAPKSNFRFSVPDFFGLVGSSIRENTSVSREEDPDSACMAALTASGRWRRGSTRLCAEQ
jgi:hypothetical protein